MTLFKSSEERAAAKVEKERKRQLAEKPMWDALAEAVRAGERGDVRAEEMAIQRGARIAEQRDPLGRKSRAFNERLEQLAKQRKLRKGKFIGVVGHIVSGQIASLRPIRAST